MNPDQLHNIEYLKHNTTFKDANPLYYSIANNWPDVIEIYFRTKFQNPNQSELLNYSALHFGIVCNAELATIKKLLDLGYDPLQKSDAGFTPRDIAEAKNSNPQIIKLLEEYEKKSETAKTLLELSRSTTPEIQKPSQDLSSIDGAIILASLRQASK